MPDVSSPNEDLRLYSETSELEEKMTLIRILHDIPLKNRFRANKSLHCENIDAFIIYTSPGGPTYGRAH